MVKLKKKNFKIAIIVVYAPAAQSTEEEIDNSHNSLDNTMALCKSQEIIITMGDLNAKFGNNEETKWTANSD